MPYRAATPLLPPRAWLHKPVIPLWIVLMAALALSRQTLGDRLDREGWVSEGAESVAVDHLLASEFDRRSISHLVLVEPAHPAATFASIQLRLEVARVSNNLAPTPGIPHFLTPLNAPTAVMRASRTSADGGAWLALVQEEEDLSASIGSLPWLDTALQSEFLHARVTGVPALTAEFGSLIKTDLLRAELIAFTIALLVLARFANGWRQALAIVLTTSPAMSALLVTLSVLNHEVPGNIFALSVAAMLTIALSPDFGLLTTLSAGELGDQR